MPRLDLWQILFGTGVVEVDETFIGGERPGKRGRGAAGKTLVVIAAQEANKAIGIGRIRLFRVDNAAGESLEPVSRVDPPPRRTGSAEYGRAWDRSSYRRMARV